MRTHTLRRMRNRIALLFAVILFGASATTSQTTLSSNGKIAFTSDRDGNREIYVMNADGTDQVRLTNNLVVDDHPNWSPDGTKIAFVSEKSSGGFAIFVMNADGTNKVEVTPLIFNATAYPIWDAWGMSWSPDGNRIVFQEKVEPSPYPAYPNHIYIVDIDGRNRRLLLDDSVDDRQPSWSPDGSKILFSRSVSLFFHNLFTIKPDGTDLRPLANTPGETDLAATWSPTGDSIAFQIFDYANFENVGVASADGSNSFWFDNGSVDPWGGRDKPDWSPDGNKIVFHVSLGASGTWDTEIFVKNVDGTGLTQLTDTPGNNFKPSWQAVARTACPNPIDCADFFISQQYRDFLGREPESSCQPNQCGLDFYLPILNGCGDNVECVHYTRGALAANFFRSPEFQASGAYVANLYNITLGQRPKTVAELGDATKVERPHYAEFIADLESLSAPTDAETNSKKDQLVAAFLQRSEIQPILPGSLTNQQFVQKLETIAGITLANESTLISSLNAGASRASVLRAVTESPEVSNQFYKSNFVMMEYFGYLRRDPEDCHDSTNWGGGDPSNCGYIFHNSRFNLSSDVDLIGNLIVRGFIESPEYRHRFGP